MTDSSSFTSLFALVDSHLSKCNIQESNSSENGRTASFPIPMISGVQRGLSDTKLASPGQRLPIPSLSMSESPIATVLSEQISNMLKAKELKKQQELEREKLQEEMKKLKLQEDNCVIDLMKAVLIPGQQRPLEYDEPASTSSSLESLIFDNPDLISTSPVESEIKINTEPILPCKTDMTYILYHKIKMGKCSPFGKVLTSRLRPVAAPYFREQVKSDIVRFDFKTKSPCDLIKEKLKKPPVYTSTNFVLDFINSTEN